MADWKNVAIADLERQIAELRAEHEKAHEAENARLRALPLKDEVERVVERIDDQITDTFEYIDNGYYDTPLTYLLRDIRSLLSRLRYSAGFTIIHDSENHGPTRDRAAEVAQTWHLQPSMVELDIAAAIRAMEVKNA